MTTHAHIHTCMSLWGNPSIHTYTENSCGQSAGSNPGPSSCEATVLTTIPLTSTTLEKKQNFHTVFLFLFFFKFTIKISSSRMNKWHGLLHVGSISPSGLQMCLLCWVEPSAVCVHFCVFPWKRSYKLYLIWNSSTPMNTHNENKLLFLGLMAGFQIHFHVTLTAADVSSI